MNSFMELLSFFSGERARVSVSLSPSYSSATSVELGAYEFDATRRVYSHPIFKQNLPESQHLIGGGEDHLSTNSPSALLSSRRASAGHQNRDTNAAYTTPAVTAIARRTATSTADTSFCRKL